jgi:hypothetical protein
MKRSDMMTTKIRLDLNQGLVEAEGSEDFVAKIYNDFKDRLTQLSAGKKLTVANRLRKRRAKTAKSTEEGERKGKAAITLSRLEIVNELSLSGNNKLPSLSDFISEYKIKNRFEKAVLIIYYLQEKLKVPAITLNHLYTCLRHLKIKTPRDLYAFVRLVKSKTGWLESASKENVRLNVHGIDQVAISMKKAE